MQGENKRITCSYDLLLTFVTLKNKQAVIFRAERWDRAQTNKTRFVELLAPHCWGCNESQGMMYQGTPKQKNISADESCV